MDWKEKLSNLLPDSHQPETEEKAATEAGIAPTKQILRVELDKRNGKPATIISEFQGTDDELKKLAKMLKNKCASGGSQRDGEILIQGDFRAKATDILQSIGYKVKNIK